MFATMNHLDIGNRLSDLALGVVENQDQALEAEARQYTLPGCQDEK